MFGGGGGPPGGGGMPHPFNMMFMPGMGGAPGGSQQGGFVDPITALLGSQGGPVDPAVLQELLGGVDMGAFGLGRGQPQPEPRSGPPPTSVSTLRTLPRIKVTPYDIAANEGSECTICLADLETGEPALRIPCGHLFHEECVNDWLKKSNECPVCRFELPTDDAEYERGRQTRMAGRKIRMRRADLDVKSAQELRRLAHFVGVDVRGCLEKSEIVERIAASPKLQIVQADAAVDPSVGGGSAAGAQTLTSLQLEAMSIGDVRSLMERLGVDASACVEKSDMVARLILSGRIVVSEDADASAKGAAAVDDPSSSAPSAAEVSGTRAAASAASGAPLAARSVGELRRLAQEHSISLAGCLEKPEIVERLQAAGLQSL
mmetsp:Transcript_29866/g.75168  ORF Transcript_29866/g.75168 Transcript_29866/m.75168 type:complete len:375 (-) Transcript_29866:450-1574(-)